MSAASGRAGTTPVGSAEGEPVGRPWWRAEWLGVLGDWAVVILLVALILGAGWLRATTIWPQATGLDEAPYEDEGVYASAAQLLVEGKQPYRDFFFAHPPIGPMLFAPATEYHYTLWGSPTTFMILRYAALAYSAVTVGLAFLIAWRLWGVAGGIVTGILLAIDPQAVWAGRHVMLESPYLFLTALAALAYVVARELEQPPPALLLLAGFFAAAAGGVKLQGLLVLVAMVIDLIVRRRGFQVLNLLAGSFLLWLPLWGYLYWLRGSDPLGQFIWFQLLRPGDGLTGFVERVRQLATDAPLLLIVGGLGLLALPTLRARPIVRARRRPRGASALELQRLPAFEEEEEAPVARPARPVAHRALTSIGATSQAEPETPTPGWTLLIPWLALTVVALALSRSYYAHYSLELSLPLALLAGALPLGIVRALRAGWGTRFAGLGLAAAMVAACAWFGPVAWSRDGERHPDRLYTIVGRYAGDAVGTDGSVFALDAQIPFRAARRPAREAENRFIVDGYGMLLYHGLRIDALPLGERFQRLFDRSGNDPYTVMWRPAAQEQLRASMGRSDLVVIDNKSDGRLTDETRQWLAAHGTLEERQDRYVIYRILR